MEKVTSMVRFKSRFGRLECEAARGGFCIIRKLDCTIVLRPMTIGLVFLMRRFGLKVGAPPRGRFSEICLLSVIISIPGIN